MFSIYSEMKHGNRNMKSGKLAETFLSNIHRTWTSYLWVVVYLSQYCRFHGYCFHHLWNYTWEIICLDRVLILNSVIGSENGCIVIKLLLILCVWCHFCIAILDRCSSRSDHSGWLFIKRWIFVPFSRFQLRKNIFWQHYTYSK